MERLGMSALIWLMNNAPLWHDDQLIAPADNHGLIPHGGDAPSNMKWQTKTEAKAKDRTE